MSSSNAATPGSMELPLLVSIIRHLARGQDPFVARRSEPSRVRHRKVPCSALLPLRHLLATPRSASATPVLKMPIPLRLEKAKNRVDLVRQAWRSRRFFLELKVDRANRQQV